MSDTGKVAVGVIVGYGRPLNPFPKKDRVIVRLDYRTVTVPVDQGQLEQIQSAHPIGGRVAVGFYGGEWHIGIAPARQESTSDIDDADLLDREMEGIDLMGLIWRPDIEKTRPSPGPGGQDTFWEDLDKYTEYLKKVEQDMQENYATILDKLGLSHLNADKKRPIQAGEDMIYVAGPVPDQKLDLIIAQNKEIAAAQKEILRLLKKISAPIKSEHRPKGKIT